MAGPPYLRRVRASVEGQPSLTLPLGGFTCAMNTELQQSRSRAPVFGISSLVAPLIATGLWFGLANPSMGIYAILAFTAVGTTLALVAGRRQEAWRPLSHIGLLLNAGGFVYVILCLFV